MKKILLVFISSLIFSISFAQTKVSCMIQANGSIDAQGNINILSLEKPLKGNKSKFDSLVNYKPLEKIIRSNSTAINVINNFISEGWLLITSVYVTKDENGRPNTPFIAYYFKKDF